MGNSDQISDKIPNKIIPIRFPGKQSIPNHWMEYFTVSVVIILQEKSPWDLNNTGVDMLTSRSVVAYFRNAMLECGPSRYVGLSGKLGANDPLCFRDRVRFAGAPAGEKIKHVLDVSKGKTITLGSIFGDPWPKSCE